MQPFSKTQWSWYNTYNTIMCPSRQLLECVKGDLKSPLNIHKEPKMFFSIALSLYFICLVLQKEFDSKTACVNVYLWIHAILHTVICGWPPQPSIFHLCAGYLTAAVSFIGASKKSGLQNWQLNNDYDNIICFSDTKQLEAKKIG